MAIADLNPREIVTLAPLFLIIIYYGVHPGPLLNSTAPSVTNLVQGVELRLAEGASADAASGGSVPMTTFGFTFALSHCLPEAILTVGALALILVGAIRERAEFIVTELAVAVLGLALLSLFSGSANAVLFGGAFIDDGFGRFAKGLCYIGSIVTLLIAHHFLVQEKINKFEFPVLVLLSTLGMSLLISANGLIALYLGLELMSLALYVVAGVSSRRCESLGSRP